MNLNTSRWKDRKDDINLEQQCNILLDIQKKSFEKDSNKRPFYSNVKVDKSFDKPAEFNINEDIITYNIFSFSFDKTVKNTNTILPDEDNISNVSGIIIIYEKNGDINYIIDKFSGSQTILRGLLNYSGKEEILANNVSVDSDFIIWLIQKVYNNNNTFEFEDKFINEDSITIESVMGFKGNSQDKVNKLTADGNTVMNLISSLTFLLESDSMEFIKMKISTDNHRSIVFKLNTNGSVNIVIDDYRGQYKKNDVERDSLISKVTLLVYLEIIPALNKWYSEDKENKVWNKEKYNKFLDELTTDIKGKIDNLKS
ncbi:hypothetical protein [Mammaliicoccus sciuri]|uniref:hypothetical protein n=1 Tax=Mammaliicoccus sciuri TaxID=1296 RepID=UPI0019502221|nr:hypothetical protein [Mammaliicoccus sciuri]MCJ0956433.1 hypothetical protein [Mammaliicoccus sciuri]MCJ1775094.1 hypothetical protein [Mammaliicoccus sciuri]